MAAGGMAGLVLVIGIIGLALRDLARAAELVVPGRISRRRIARLLALPRLHPAEPQPWTRGEKRRLVLAELVVAAEAAPLSAAAGMGEVVLVEGDPALAQALFAAIAGLAMPLSGTARWNGADLCARRPARRRRIVGLASDLLPVLPGSNGFNLRYRAPCYSEREQTELARAWEIDPAGHDEQPHRLALVRALLGQPPVLLLSPPDRALCDADARRLAEAIGAWPGVVLLATRHPLLAARATRCWRLSTEGLSETALPLIPRIACPTERAA